MSKNEKCTCKACKTIVFHCQICKFVTFLLPSSSWLLKLPNIRRVFRLQERAARVILGAKTKEERTIKLFKKLEWLPFYDEINVIKLCLVFKCLNGQCPEYLSNTPTRISHGYFYEAVEVWEHNSKMPKILAWNRGRKDICSRSSERVEQAPN